MFEAHRPAIPRVAALLADQLLNPTSALVDTASGKRKPLSIGWGWYPAKIGYQIIGGRPCNSLIYLYLWWTHKGSNLGPLPCE
jgi:hypothetical protein